MVNQTWKEYSVFSWLNSPSFCNFWKANIGMIYTIFSFRLSQVLTLIKINCSLLVSWNHAFVAEVSSFWGLFNK